MDIKRALTNGVFCPMPWKGLMYNFNGTVKNCIRSAGTIGDLKEHSIEEILAGEKNQHTQSCMLADEPGPDCHTCYNLENGKKRFDIVSDRIFYIRELKEESYNTYQQGKHDLKTIDVRWSNLCNFSCVYCDPQFSSKWANELGERFEQPSEQQLNQFKNYIFDRADQLKHVYLAGGEPLLMKQNLELLEILQQRNPDVHLRINTNLSKTDTQVFDKLCEFKNVHWTVSTETMHDEFEYIRHGGKWKDFEENLDILNGIKDHKVSFNMLYFLLNYHSLFNTIDYFKSKGFHNNSFIIGPLLGPLYLNVRHLPEDILQSIGKRFEREIDLKPGYLLEDSYKNILHYIKQPFDKDLQGSLAKLRILDKRRGINSETVFEELYKLANYIHQGNQTWQNHLT